MSVNNFCPECNNMLYPKEDKANKRLLFACRHCAFSTLATTNLVYANSLTQTTISSLIITPELTLDPTLQRTKKVTCNRCGHTEAVFFARSEERMELVFVCCNLECAHYWVQGEKSDKQSASQSQSMALSQA